MLSSSKKAIFSVYFLLATLSLFAQYAATEKHKASEDSIRNMFSDIYKSRNDDFKKSENQKIDSIFARILRQPESFGYPFDSLKTIGHLYAPDNSFRIINWNIALEEGTFIYFGYIQTYDNKTKAHKLYRLNDRKEDITDPENIVLSAGKWYGALYYNILRQKVDNKFYYTMLALQFNNALLSRKLIEVLYFDEWGNPVFGAPIFKADKKLKHRIVFQYSAKVVMSLQYDKKLKMIVFDHLSPSESRYTNEFEYYGPDLSFDGFEFKKSQWILRTNLDLRKPTGSVR